MCEVMNLMTSYIVKFLKLLSSLFIRKVDFKIVILAINRYIKMWMTILLFLRRLAAHLAGQVLEISTLSAPISPHPL